MKKKYYITLAAAGVGALGTIIAAFISSYQNNIISDDRKVINICQSNNLTDNHDTNKITTITAENGYDEDAPISPSEFNNSIKKETKNYISETSQVTSDTIVDNSNSNITNTVTTPFSETVLYSYFSFNVLIIFIKSFIWINSCGKSIITAANIFFYIRFNIFTSTSI